MISLISTVESALRNDTALKVMVNNRIYWIRSSGKPDYPYITYFEVTNTEAESADDEEYADEIEIQIDIWHTGSPVAIARETQRIMRSLGFTHQAMADDYDEKTKVIHKPIRFTMVKEV